MKVDTLRNKTGTKKLTFKKISRSIKEEDENSDSGSESVSGTKTSPSLVSRRSEANQTSISKFGALNSFSKIPK